MNKICGFGKATAAWLAEVTASRRRKSLSVEHSVPQDLANLTPCLNRLPQLLRQLASRLRRLDDDCWVVKIFC